MTEPELAEWYKAVEALGDAIDRINEAIDKNLKDVKEIIETVRKS